MENDKNLIKKDTIDYNKLSLIKEELIKISEEYLYADTKTSSANNIQNIFKLVRKEYDF